MDYDDQNIFAKILRGELPAVKVHEDDRTLAFMDIMPRATGHCLVIPKASVRNLLDCSDEDLAACIALCKRLANAVRVAFGVDGVTLLQSNEKAADQEVFHLHFHVIPRDGGALKAPASEMEETAILEANAARIRDAL